MQEADNRSEPGIRPFTMAILDELRRRSYDFVTVEGYSADRRLDYVHPNYLLLTPHKRVKSPALLQDIYEPIDSELLNSWASDAEGTRVFIVWPLKK